MQTKVQLRCRWMGGPWRIIRDWQGDWSDTQNERVCWQDRSPSQNTDGPCMRAGFSVHDSMQQLHAAQRMG